MSLLFRSVRVLLVARYQARALVLDELTVRLRVWPHDLDHNLHNNGRYLAVMDLGHLDFMAHAAAHRGLARPLVSAGTSHGSA